MVHIVFIVGSYYPYYSAVGKCVGNVADELCKENRVTIICEKNFNNQNDNEKFNNQYIIRVNTKENFIRNRLAEKIHKANSFNKKIYKLILITFKLFIILKGIFSENSVKKNLVKEYLKAIENIDEQIDVICPACMPFESIVAASIFKEKNNDKLKIIPYLFDQFSESQTIYRVGFNKLLKQKKNIEIEKKVFKNCYAILAMHSLRNHFNKYLEDIRNVRYVEHPLLIRSNTKIEEINNKSIIISYVGGLYKGYVEADYFLEVYKNIKLENCILNFYVIGNCLKIIDKYEKLLPQKIINHGSVVKEIANKAISQSDILISIAEKKGIQMSSKIFEYISNGKPIIHFYTVDNDVNLKILCKYPLSLCLKQDYQLLEDNIKKFNEFCKINFDKRIDFKEVEEIFDDAIPRYTANIISNYFNKLD